MEMMIKNCKQRGRKRNCFHTNTHPKTKKHDKQTEDKMARNHVRFTGYVPLKICTYSCIKTACKMKMNSECASVPHFK
jgi:hypothetical protein